MSVAMPLLDWLLAEGEPWVQYRTRRDLLDQPEDLPQVRTARAAMLSDPRVTAMVASLQDWPGPPLKNHKQAGHHLHRLAFLAEIGLRLDDRGMGTIVKHILAHQSEEGAFLLRFELKRGKVDTNGPVLGWMLCDAPLVLWILCKLGAEHDPRVKRAAQHLVEHLRDDGWPCVTGGVDGFRGPGRKADPCPYATLLVLRALTVYEGELTGKEQAIHTGIETLLSLWAARAERRPYLFGMGTDFRKPKLPLVWYDILHVLDTLSWHRVARQDARYDEMRAVLLEQADEIGRFTPGSMYRAWKEWQFADKKHPSPAVTLFAWRALLRSV